MYRLTRFYSAFLLLFTGAFFLAACTDDPEAVDDMDGDDIIVEEEPIDAYDADANFYDTWDTDRDARLTRDEFSTGVGTGTWWNDRDTDRDTYLSEDEFNAAYSNETWYTPTTYGDWDVNDDNLLDRSEWETGLFDTWDTNRDTYLTADEYDEGLFD